MTLEEEIDAAVRKLRQQHEIEVGRCVQLEQYMEAHHRDLVERIRGIREREAYRRTDAARELVALASEIGLIPNRLPEPMQVQSDASDMPAFLAKHHAAEEVDRVFN
jgi:phage terminase small subunit